MIVTRRRRRRSHAGRYVLPIVALIALTIALTWPPSQTAIANGPLRPVWLAGARIASVVFGPLRFAAQQQQITERNQQIRDLNARLEQERVAVANSDARVQQLQQQMAGYANQPRPTAAPAVKPAAARLADATAMTGAASATGSDADRKLAATWSSMDPEKASAMVQRLPDDEVVRILALMDPTAAAAIMDALPPAVSARLSRSGTQVAPASDR